MNEKFSNEVNIEVYSVEGQDLVSRVLLENASSLGQGHGHGLGHIGVENRNENDESDSLSRVSKTPSSIQKSKSSRNRIPKQQQQQQQQKAQHKRGNKNTRENQNSQKYEFNLNVDTETNTKTGKETLDLDLDLTPLELQLENRDILSYVERRKGCWDFIYNHEGKPNAQGLIKEFIYCMCRLGYLTRSQTRFDEDLGYRDEEREEKEEEDVESVDEVVSQVNKKLRFSGTVTKVGGAFITISCYSESFKNELAAIQGWIISHANQFIEPNAQVFVYTTQFKEIAPHIHNYLWNNKSRLQISQVFQASVTEWILHDLSSRRNNKEFPFLALFFLFQSSMGGDHEPNLFLACKETGPKMGRDHLHMAMVYQDSTTMSQINLHMKAGFWSKICHEFQDKVNMPDTLHLTKLTELGGLLNYMYKEGKQERYFASNPAVHRNTALFRTRYLEKKGIIKEKRNSRVGVKEIRSVSSLFSELMIRWVLFMIYTLKDEKYNLLSTDRIRFIANSFEHLRTAVLVTQEIRLKFCQYIVQYGKTLPDHLNGLLSLAKKPFIAEVKQIVLGCNYAPLDYHLKMVSIWISSRLAGIKNAATHSYRQKSTWLVGGPSIGKSTIFQLLKHCYVGVYPLAKRSGFQVEYDAEKENTIFGQLDEAGTSLGGQSIESGGTADMVNMLKEWTENGSAVEINQKYKPVQTRESFFPLIITSNNPPDHGINDNITTKDDREALFTFFKLPEPGQTNKDHWNNFIAQYTQSKSRIMAFELGQGMYDGDLDTNKDDKINWSVKVRLQSGIELSITSEDLYSTKDGNASNQHQNYLDMAKQLDMGPELDNFIRLLSAKGDCIIWK